MCDLSDLHTWRAIESAGGPLLLLPEAALPAWTGVAGADYARACAVTGRLGTLTVGRDHAQVIGDEPTSTALYPARSADSLVITLLFEPERDISLVLHWIRALHA